MVCFFTTLHNTQFHKYITLSSYLKLIATKTLKMYIHSLGTCLDMELEQTGSVCQSLGAAANLKCDLMCDTYPLNSCLLQGEVVAVKPFLKLLLLVVECTEFI